MSDARERPELDDDLLEQMDDAVNADEVVRTPDGAGRLLEPDEGAHTDDEASVVAELVDEDRDAMSAEEAAIHVVEEP